MEKKTHKKKNMRKNEYYRLVCQKLLDAHRSRNVCNCSENVLNLRLGRLVWTHIQFECGERIKINCSCLEK